jgi:hypothetical protein
MAVIYENNGTLYGLSTGANMKQSEWEAEKSAFVQFLHNIFPTQRLNNLSSNRKARQLDQSSTALELNRQNIEGYGNSGLQKSNTGLIAGVAVILLIVIGTVIYSKKGGGNGVA